LAAFKPAAGVLSFHFVNADHSAYVPIGASAFTVNSALRFKQDIATWEGDALSIVDDLRPITYRQVDGPPPVADDPDPPPVTTPPTQLGFLAEEVDDVLPDAVTYDDDGPLSIDLGALVTVLTRAVQQLTERVATLEGAGA
jgi:hypothetical protein